MFVSGSPREQKRRQEGPPASLIETARVGAAALVRQGGKREPSSQVPYDRPTIDAPRLRAVEAAVVAVVAAAHEVKSSAAALPQLSVPMDISCHRARDRLLAIVFSELGGEVEEEKVPAAVGEAESAGLRPYDGEGKAEAVQASGFRAPRGVVAGAERARGAAVRGAAARARDAGRCPCAAEAGIRARRVHLW